MSTVAIPQPVPSKTSEDRAVRWRIALLIAACYSISLCILGSVLRTQWGFPLDDSYIHQTVARNFVHYGVLGFIPGVPSSGSTSVLWPLVQAVNFKLLHLDPVTFNFILCWLLLGVIG